MDAIRRQGARGLTLVELMIAITLMLIVTLQLQIIFGHSRRLYLGADAMAQVYSNARSAFDQIEKDVANAVKTDQMEFFNDRRTTAWGVGHYEPGVGEENAQIQGKYIPGRYIHAMAFRQYKDYQPKDADKVGTDYRHDSVYFRSFTTVKGQPREVLIEYRLWLGNDASNPRPRPILQRIVTGPRIDATTGLPMYDANGNPILERGEPQDVCRYVQEFKVDFFIQDKRRHTAGRFYSPKEAILKVATAEDRYPPGLENMLGGGDEAAVQCLDGSVQVDENATISTTDGKLYLRNGDRIARLGPGDKIYVLTRQVGNFRIDFKNRYLTIKSVETPNQQLTVVSFEEEEAILQVLGGGGSGGLPAISTSYRGGWLPPAIRVQMKIKDQRSQEVRTITRIFQLLRA